MITARRSHTGTRSTRQALTAPPLQSGGRLTGTEFLRHCTAMPYNVVKLQALLDKEAAAHQALASRLQRS
jgi:hypothetical protein